MAIKVPVRRLSKVNGLEYIKFKVPSRLNTVSSGRLNAMLERMRYHIDTVTLSAVGIPMSEIVMPKRGDMNLYSRFYLRDMTGKPFVLYSTDTENHTGFSLVIWWITEEVYENHKPIPLDED